MQVSHQNGWPGSSGAALLSRVRRALMWQRLHREVPGKAGLPAALGAKGFSKGGSEHTVCAKIFKTFITVKKYIVTSFLKTLLLASNMLSHRAGHFLQQL